MGGKSDFLETQLLSHILGRTTYTAPATLYIALFNISPGDDGGAEIGGLDYARVAYTNNPSDWTTPVQGQRANANEISFPIVGSGAWGTIVSFAIMDQSSGGNMLYWGDLYNPIDTEDGDTIQFNPGEMVVTED